MLTKAVTAAEAKVLAQGFELIAADGVSVRPPCPHFHKQRQVIVSLADD